MLSLVWGRVYTSMQNDASTRGDASVPTPHPHPARPYAGRNILLSRGSLDEGGRIPGYVRIARPGRRKRPYADNERDMIWLRTHFLHFLKPRPSLLYETFHMLTAFLNILKCVDCGENIRTPHGIARVWLKPSKVLRQDVDRAILVPIKHHSALGTNVRSLVKRHGLQMPTAATLFRRIFLI